MQRMQQLAVVLTALVLALLLLGPATSATARSASSRSLLTATDDPAGAARLLELVNADRVAAGVRPLEARADLTAIAQAQSRLMAAAGSIWHNDDLFSDSVRHGLDALVLGENVAFDGGGTSHIHWMLMNSPHHRANILDPRFDVAGFAITTVDGTAYVTEDFAQTRPAAAPAPPPAPVAPAAVAPVEPPAPTTTTAPPAAPPTTAAPVTPTTAAPAPVATVPPAPTDAPVRAVAQPTDPAPRFEGPTDQGSISPALVAALAAVDLSLAALAAHTRRRARLDRRGATAA